MLKEAGMHFFRRVTFELKWRPEDEAPSSDDEESEKQKEN
jgi:hypothetical protein